MRSLIARLFVAAVVWTGACALTAAPEDGIPQSLPLVPLTIETRAGEVALKVQVADTDPRRQTGLMFRKSMPETEGMLFVFDMIRPVAFWMKNTYIPLDLLFVDADGTVTRIARDTVPFSLDPIPSELPARAVLEINAGASARLGIDVGDRLVHGTFDAQAAPGPEPRP